LPPGTAYHVNYYQSETPGTVFEPEGDATNGASPPIRENFDFDSDAKGNKKNVMSHFKIDDNDEVVHQGILKHIKAAHGWQPG
jgi:hypothetical protein